MSFEFNIKENKIPICKKKFKDIDELDGLIKDLKLKFRGNK